MGSERVITPLNVCMHRVDENESVKCFTLAIFALWKRHSEKCGEIASIV